MIHQTIQLKPNNHPKLDSGPTKHRIVVDTVKCEIDTCDIESVSSDNVDNNDRVDGVKDQ